MDLQKMINSMNQQHCDDRCRYHLTYGELIDALKSAPKKAKYDKRIKGIDSWRGSYIEIAILTEDNGLYCQDSEFDGDYKEYDKWEKEHATSVDKLPKTANELGELLESILGKEFIGWKGGSYTITKDKPLWLEKSGGACAETPIIGIDKNLNLILGKVNES